jgi:KipI family sensor histidine kinase inhibitor
MRVLPVTAGCVLVELADLGETLALLKAMHRDPIAGVGEIIPAARTLLVQFDPAEISLDALTDVLASRRGADIEKGPGPLVEIPVRYDGEDLQEVAGLTGTTVDEVVRRHCGRDYLVAFTGFAPGFAYLADGDPRLAVPRRTSPRTHVPAGSVGLAGAFSGIYPKASPGGWQLIGNTPLTMFDLDRTPASLLQPGYRVRFRDMAISAPYEIAQTTRKSPVKTATRKGAATAAAMEIAIIGIKSSLDLIKYLFKCVISNIAVFFSRNM